MQVTVTQLSLFGEGTFLVMAVREKHFAWMQKAFHVKHPYALTEPYFSSITLNASLTWGGLSPAMESAIQDQVVKTENY
jgi:hypothetical protein